MHKSSTSTSAARTIGAAGEEEGDTTRRSAAFCRQQHAWLALRDEVAMYGRACGSRSPILALQAHQDLVYMLLYIYI